MPLNLMESHVTLAQLATVREVPIIKKSTVTAHASSVEKKDTSLVSVPVLSKVKAVAVVAAVVAVVAIGLRVSPVAVEAVEATAEKAERAVVGDSDLAMIVPNRR